MAANKPLSVTLMIPGLTAISSGQWEELTPGLPALPALSELLRRSRRVSVNSTGFESMLGVKFGLPSQQPPPVAALTYWHDKGQPPSKTVLRADPVYLKVDRDRLYLLGRRSLQVSREEANKLVSQINQLYSDTRWSIEIGAADRWYVSSENKIRIETTPLTDAFGKNIDGYLPRGAAGKNWRAVLNEIQMLLHTSEVNLQREMSGRLPINSVWLWGEGALPSRPVQRIHKVDYVWSDEPLCRGMARWAQCPGDELPSTPSEWIKQTEAGQHLIVFDDIRMLAREDFQSWESKLTEWDETWLAILREAVKNNQLQLSIETDNAMVFECSSTLWNKWRHKKRLWYEWLQ